MLKKALIRLAKRILQSILQQLMQQFNVVTEQALNPMNQMVQAVMGGVWVGEGANAFVEEVSSLMIPGVGKVMDNITFVHGNLQFAQDVMERADETVNNKVNGLADVFGGVY